MVQIYQDRPSFASQLAGATTNALGQFGQAFAEQKLEQRKKQELSRQSDLENEQIKSNFGIDLSGIRDPKIREKILESGLKTSQAHQEKIQPLKSGLDTVKRMRELGKSGHLGPKISQWGGLGFASSDVRKDRAEYEQLGKSLISLASTIPIRNQMEFDVLSKSLYDPSITDAGREGILDAMEKIIRNSMGDFDGGLASGVDQEQASGKQQMRRTLSHFGH